MIVVCLRAPSKQQSHDRKKKNICHSRTISFFVIVFFFLFDVYECFACMRVCVPHVCLVPTGGRSHQIPWNCSYRWL